MRKFFRDVEKFVISKFDLTAKTLSTYSYICSYVSVNKYLVYTFKIIHFSRKNCFIFLTAFLFNLFTYFSGKIFYQIPLCLFSLRHYFFRGNTITSTKAMKLPGKRTTIIEQKSGFGST